MQQTENAILFFFCRLVRVHAGNGYITTAVLREILAALDDKLTPDQLDEMIDEIDTDGSGTVDFEGTFLRAWLRSSTTTTLLYFLHLLSGLNGNRFVEFSSTEFMEMMTGE
jgi:hypothetical protein